MTRERFTRAKQLFLEACELPVDERPRFLSEACGGDADLHREVQSLLEFDVMLADDLSEGAPDAFPDSIHNFRIVRRIGEGGMGDVFEAEQLAPVRRRVALKLVRVDLASKAVVARFEAERQALALMNHPSIATVYEAGATARGRPFFAMELVDGLPVTEYCDDHLLGLSDRLALFVRICDGLQHAHHKGVIHRDIKPSNVLVAEEDGRPLPKIIDFGLAKAISLRLTEKTLYTQHGQWIGTPEYMSPEQAGLSDGDVDTRTDVYALGVLLYELLVGARPFDAETLLGSGLEEMFRVLREQDPPRPSARVSTLGEASSSVAERRRTDAPSLARLLRGDLDLIVMKALEKERDRRYGSAADMAADVKRFLANQSVLARPPSTAYRVRKLVARNRLAVTAGVVVLVSLIAGITGTTLAMIRARREAGAARQVAEAMATVFDTLNPAASDWHLQSARRALSAGAEVIQDQLEDQPLVRGRLLMMMGRTYLNLADADRGVAMLEEALALWRAEPGDDATALGELYGSLGGGYLQRGGYGSALASFERSVAIHEQHLGPEDTLTGWAVAVLGHCLTMLGDYERAQSMLDRAERILAAAHGPDSDYVAGVLQFKGVLLLTLGDYDAAEAALERSVANHERWLGRDHTGVAGPLTELAMVHSLAGEEDLAEEQFRRALEINRRAFGGEHYSLAYPLRELGRIEAGRGNLEAAHELIGKALSITESTLGKEHPALTWTLRAHGSVLRRMGDTDGARSALERGLAIAEATYGSTHWEIASLLDSLGYLEYELGRLPEARRCFERALAILEQVFPLTHRMAGLTCYQLACLAALRGERDEAIDLLRRTLATDWVSEAMFEDPDLDSLRGGTGFEEILEEFRQRLGSEKGRKGSIASEGQA